MGRAGDVLYVELAAGTRDRKRRGGPQRKRYRVRDCTPRETAGWSFTRQAGAWFVSCKNLGTSQRSEIG